MGDGAAVERARVALEAHGEQLEVRGALREGAEERADLQPDVVQAATLRCPGCNPRCQG